MQRRKYFKQCAKDIIFSSSGSGIFDNLFSVMILAAVSAGLLQTSYIFITLFEPYVTESAVNGLAILFTALWFFAVCPVIYGFAKRMIYVSEGYNPSVSAMFCAFSSRREAALSYRLFFTFALWGICLKAVLLLIDASPLFERLAESSAVADLICALGFTEVVSDITSASRIFASALAITASILALERLLCTLYVTARGFTSSVKTAYRVSGKIMKGKRFELLKILLSFIPWLILSFFTFGVVFAVFVLPYISVTAAMFFRYAERRYTFESGDSFADRTGIKVADDEYLSGADSAIENFDSTQTHSFRSE